MVAFNLLLSIFPVLLLCLYVAGRVIRSPDLERAVVVDLQRLFPSASSATLGSAVTSLRQASHTLGLVGIVGSLWASSSFWGALDTSFCRIYGPPCRTWLRQKRFALAMTLVLLGLIATTAALPALQSIGAHGTQRLPFGLSHIPHAVYLLTLVVGHLALFGLLALVYATVPLRRPRWSAIWPGAAVATAIASLVSVLFPLYAAQATLAHAGATVGFALLVLVWFYVVALGLLAGATLNALRADGPELVGDRRDRSPEVRSQL